MKNLGKYITALLITAIIIAGINAASVFAAHTDELHEATYFGGPGDVLRGQVTIMNPSDEAKVIEAAVQSCRVHNEQWLFLDQTTFNMGPNAKTVIPYRVVVPPQAEDDCVNVVHIREVAPRNTLSLKHVVSVFVTGPGSLLGAAYEVNIFYTTIFIMFVVAFGIGVAVCIILGMKNLPKLWNRHKKKGRKKRK